MTQSKRTYRKERSLFEADQLKALKNEIKGSGWRIKQNIAFIELDGLLIQANIGVNKLKQQTRVTLAIKPMSLDPTYWNIVGLEDNNSAPLSFRAWGVFVCSSLPVNERVLEDQAGCPATLAEQIFAYMAESLENRERLFSFRSFSSIVSVHPQYIKNGAHAISLVVSLIDEQKFAQANTLANKYVTKELTSCNNHNHLGKDFHELAMQWLQDNGHVG